MKLEFQDLVVHDVKREATNVLSFDIRHPDGASLPAFTAGGHLDIKLPNGLVRSYSLVNSQDDTHRYLIAVNKDAASRGGSRFMHDHLGPGATVAVGLPRNHFPLNEEAEHSTFVAGGIGITPMLCMIERLNALQRHWALFYFARSRATAAFTSVIEALENAGSGRARFIFDEGRAGSVLGLEKIIVDAPKETHFYCCGPVGMLERFEQVTSNLAPQYVHREYFSAQAPAPAEGEFVVELAKSQRSLVVAPGKTILDTLLDAGIEVAYSCSQGVCGACETTVLEGIPEHHDLVLSPEAQASHKTMMICCSGSRSPKLVLDI
ncbi:PDR/VanB family oxidoreductase [Hydrogenophaga sp.]|jgi:ferredoxin-NADP reductase|uniref:PDR/VanB family oxidoreductase n=1 Tax=Hydrogenophaga sp. TaxID=1904254 RepID=UPI003F6F4064